MESNSTGLKALAPPPAAAGRREAAEPAAQTALPPSKAVSPIEATDEAQRASSKTPRTADGHSGETSDDRKIEIDPETREVLFKITDADTGMVRWQVPAEALLKMRAYNTEGGVPTTRPDAAEDDETGPEQRVSRAL